MIVFHRFFEVSDSDVGEGLRREDGGAAGVLHRPVAHGFQIHGHAGDGFVAGFVGSISCVFLSLHPNLLQINT